MDNDLGPMLEVVVPGCVVLLLVLASGPVQAQERAERRGLVLLGSVQVFLAEGLYLRPGIGVQLRQ